jgi:DNA-binding MarR family transcriptional regulator
MEPRAHRDRTHASYRPILVGLILMGTLALPLAAIAPSALAAPSYRTTFADGSSSASLYFASCGDGAEPGSFLLPFNAVVERMDFTLTTTGNTSGQNGTVASYIGGRTEASSNVTVNSTSNATLAGHDLNAFLHEAGATEGNVSVPFRFVGCSATSDWWVSLTQISILYRTPTEITFTLLSPGDGVTYTSNATQLVTGSVAPEDCTVSINGHPITSNGTFAETVGLELGENHITVAVCANYGNEQAVTRTVVRDLATVNLTIAWPPAEYLTNRTNVTVRGSTDPWANVTVAGENASVNATTGAFERDVTGLSDLFNRTENVIEVVATDGLGGRRSVNITVIVDTKPPVIDLNLGADLAAALEHGVCIRWSEVEIGGTTDWANTHVWVNGVNASHDGLHFGALVALEEGNNTVVVSAQDGAGNTAQVEINICVDLTAPSIKLDLDEQVAAAIEAGTALNNSTVLIRGRTDSADATIVVNEHVVALDNQTFSVTLELIEGANTVVIVAEDSAGNRREVRLNILIDTEAPNLFVIFGGDVGAAIEHGHPLRNGTVTARVESDAAQVRVYLNEDLVTTGNGSFEVAFELREGLNVLAFVADDGNLTTRREYHLTLDTTAPTLSVELEGVTEVNGTLTHEGALLTLNGTTEPGAAVSLCTQRGENATENCHGVDVGAHGAFHGSVELSAEVTTTVRVVAQDAAGNTNSTSYDIVRTEPTFGNDTELHIGIGGGHEDGIRAGDELVFEVGSEVAIPDGAVVMWYVDGELVGNGTRVAGVALEEGTHEIEVRVEADGTVASQTVEVSVAPAGAQTAPGAAAWFLPLLLLLGLVAAGGATAGTERGRYFLLAGLLGSVFTRLKKPAPLDHFVRGRLYQLIDDDPGIHYAELRRRAKLSSSAAAHHLHVLETAGIVRVVVDGTRTRFYATDKPLDSDTYGLSDGDRVVLTAVTQQPGLTETELSQRVDRSLSTVSRSVERLATLGYVSTSRQGRTVNVFPREGADVPDAAGGPAWPTDEA